MGVYVDQYFGYFVDVSDDIEALDYDDFYDTYLMYDDSHVLRELKQLGYRAYDANPTDVEFVIDGMCDDYSYLVYVVSVDRFSSNMESVPDSVNEALKFAPVPDEAVEKLSKIYEKIFGKKLDKGRVVARQLAYCH